MRTFAQVFTAFAIVMASAIGAAGCHSKSSDHAFASGTAPLIGLIFKNTVNGQEITTWQLRPGESLTIQVVGVFSGGFTRVLTGNEIGTPTLSNVTVGSVTKNGDNVVFNAGGNTGNVDVIITATVNNSTRSGEVDTIITNNPVNNNGPNNPNSTAPLSSFQFKNDSVTGTQVVQPLDVLINTTKVIYISARLTDGNDNIPVNDTEITGLGNDNLVVGSISKNGGNLFFTATNLTGTANITVTVNKNGNQITNTLQIRVVSSNPNPQPSGGSGNPGTVITNLSISAPNFNPNVGQPIQLSVSGTVTNVEAVNWEISRSDLDARRGVMSADGRFFPANANSSVAINAWGLGSVYNNPQDSAENWNQAIVSNTVTVTSSGTTPTGIMVFVPAYMSVGERYQFFIKELDTGNDLTTQVTPGSSDNNVLTTTNNSSGQPFVFRALKPGIVTVSATYGNKTFSTRVRVGVGNPLVTQYSGVRVIDTYVRFGMPFRNPNNSNEWMVPMLFSLSKCADFSSPKFLLFPVNGSINGTSAPSLRTVTEEGTNVLWGEHIFTFTGDSGSLNLDPFQYVGKAPSTINTSEFNDTSKYSFPVDIHRSRFYDVYNNGNDRNFLVTFERSSDPANFRVNMRDLN